MTEVDLLFVDARLQKIEDKLKVIQNTFELMISLGGGQVNLRILMDEWRKIDGEEPLK